MPPASTSSRPASIRSAVVLPEPDGPTSTMNSPSAMSRSSASTAASSFPGYTRVACRKCTSAIDHLREFVTHAGLGLAVCAELVEREQRGPDDRRRPRHPDGDTGKLGADPLDHTRILTLQGTPAKEYLDLVADETEA